ncbi:unnamed protein product [Caenorhabditis angaria]|uniref:Major facilitator superfamily (MFS) profile domain-containing protein n=1 Tax=Caenorhabditis angaria TaxID=860376 RepID=A0A9P1J450_9PELO|nr:unnamed protein product [Caenorhabditis angaria]
MLLNIPRNLLYTVIIFCIVGFYNDLQLMFFSTLPVAMENIINSTISRYGKEPNSMSISLLTSAMNSVGSIGTVIGIFFFLPISDQRGRKFVCVHIRSYCGLFSSFFYLVSAYFESAEFFILAEFVYGAQLPVRFFATSVFVSESSPDQCRGFATFALMVGSALANMVMFSLATPSLFGSPNSWFVFPLTTLILSVICFFLLLRIHESPKWLIRQKRFEEAERAIEFYHGKNVNKDEILYSMVREKNLTISKKLSLKQIVNDDTLWEAFKIVGFVYAFILISPNTAEGVYMASLNTTAGLTIEQTLTVLLVFSIIFLPGPLIGTFLIDKLGRRKMVFFTGFVMISKTWILTTTLTCSEVFGTSVLTRISVIFTDMIGNLQHVIGINSIGPLLISELFPQAARTSVGQLFTLIGVFSYIPSVIVFPIIDAIFTPIFFVPFMFLQPIFLYFLYKKLPETKLRSVADIIESLDDVVTSRRNTYLNEKSPLIKDRAITFSTKRGSIIKTQRKRSKTMDYKKLDLNDVIIF